MIDFIEKQVSVITNDGRNIIGRLRGFDQVCNIILEKSFEREFSKENGVLVLSLGLYVIRGDNIAVIGEVDVDKDKRTNWENIKVCEGLHHLYNFRTFQTFTLRWTFF